MKDVPRIGSQATVEGPEGATKAPVIGCGEDLRHLQASATETRLLGSISAESLLCAASIWGMDGGVSEWRRMRAAVKEECVDGQSMRDRVRNKTGKRQERGKADGPERNGPASSAMSVPMSAGQSIASPQLVPSHRCGRFAEGVMRRLVNQAHCRRNSSVAIGLARQPLGRSLRLTVRGGELVAGGLGRRKAH